MDLKEVNQNKNDNISIIFAVTLIININCVIFVLVIKKVLVIFQMKYTLIDFKVCFSGN